MKAPGYPNPQLSSVAKSMARTVLQAMLRAEFKRRYNMEGEVCYGEA
jgi:hypothetical protein